MIAWTSQRACTSRIPILLLMSAPLVVSCANHADDCELTLCSSTDATGGTGGGSGTGASGAGGVGMGGAGGMGSTTPECQPESITGAVPPECGVFVNGDASEGDGTQASPYSTITEAVAASNGVPIYVCASSAGYSEAVTIDASMDLFGGFDCDSWEASGDKVAWTATPDEVPLVIAGAETQSRVDGFVITSADADLPGRSSIAMLVTEATVDVTNVNLLAGAGAVGGIGGTPAGTGMDGAAGGNGGAGSGGSGGQRLCGTTNVGGGKGGFPQPPLYTGSGSPGQPQPMGYAPVDGMGGAGSATACGTGHDGASGSPGMPGAGATGIGSLSASGYAGGIGDTGSTPGGPGQGGGGGGSDTNDALGGGGGGSGGCGGGPGQGGKGGGSSIALAVVTATVSLTTVNLTTSNGGVGGAGSAGQMGGAGGAKGSGYCAGTLCQQGHSCGGGVGGQGGRGGAGGGGQGGHSVAIAHVGDPPSETDVDFSTGSAGSGGPGGDGGSANQGGAGVDGMSAKRIWFGD